MNVKAQKTAEPTQEPLKVLIVEDEAYVRDEIKYMLSRYDRLTIAGEADNPFDAICEVHKVKPDIVFLDIKLHDAIDGIELGKRIVQAAPHVRIVFVTAFDDRAIDGFEVGAVDYVLKPFSEERLSKTIERLLPEDAEDKHKKTLSRRGSDKIIMKKNQIWKPVDVADICYFKSSDHVTTAVTADDSYTLNLTLRELEDTLPPGLFLRTHKSFIVNLDCIHEIIPWFNYTYKIILKDRPEEIPVSRNYMKQFKATLAIS